MTYFFILFKKMISIKFTSGVSRYLKKQRQILELSNSKKHDHCFGQYFMLLLCWFNRCYFNHYKKIDKCIFQNHLNSYFSSIIQISSKNKTAKLSINSALKLILLLKLSTLFLSFPIYYSQRDPRLFYIRLMKNINWFAILELT